MILFIYLFYNYLFVYFRNRFLKKSMMTEIVLLIKNKTGSHEQKICIVNTSILGLQPKKPLNKRSPIVAIIINF